MKNKICVIAAVILMGSACNAIAEKIIPITPQKQQLHEIVNWTSANSSDILTIQALGTFFTVHLSVAPTSLSSISLTCASNAPVTITPGSNIVCFVDDGFIVSWESTSAGTAAFGTYEII